MTTRFDILDIPIIGLKVLHRKPIGDNRGYFERFFCQEELKSVLDGKAIVQVNHSRSNKAGTIRGLHFQHPPHAEKKFISCLRGAIFDVAVDIRQNSPTFLQWYGEILSEDNHKTLLVPEGFAHGFQALSADSEIIYLCTAAYAPEAENGLNPLDARVGIAWPLAITELSDHDRLRPNIESSFKGLQL